MKTTGTWFVGPGRKPREEDKAEGGTVLHKNRLENGLQQWPSGLA